VVSVPAISKSETTYLRCLLQKNECAQFYLRKIQGHLDSVMHDETIFPDSYKFDPTRFLDEEGNLQGLENILPFSLGKFA
jgi:hypothetical protein